MWSSLAVVGLAALETILSPVLFLLPAMNQPPLVARIAGGVFGFFLATAVSVFWFGTMWRCLVSSNHTAVAKVGWLLLMLTTNLVGALIYYFVRRKKERLLTVEV
jgi:hypothetical protein